MHSCYYAIMYVEEKTELHFQLSYMYNYVFLEFSADSQKTGTIRLHGHSHKRGGAGSGCKMSLLFNLFCFSALIFNEALCQTCQAEINRFSNTGKNTENKIKMYNYRVVDGIAVNNNYRV